jgi:hypothetical protein
LSSISPHPLLAISSTPPSPFFRRHNQKLLLQQGVLPPLLALLKESSAQTQASPSGAPTKQRSGQPAAGGEGGTAKMECYIQMCEHCTHITGTLMPLCHDDVVRDRSALACLIEVRARGGEGG